MTKDTLPSPVSVPEGDAREIARKLANAMARHIIGENFAGDNAACRKCVEMVTAALLSAESRARPQWQPIETAPKDRFIFVWCPEDRSRWLAKWQGDRWYGVDDNGLTREAQNAVTGWTVTHWQPLPAPPLSPEEW